ncbi:hypothetical protein ACFZ22_001391, partial [Neisseria gonorrhoeae]
GAVLFVLLSLICSVLSSYFEGNISANLVQTQKQSTDNTALFHPPCSARPFVNRLQTHRLPAGNAINPRLC